MHPASRGLVSCGFGANIDYISGPLIARVPKEYARLACADQGCSVTELGAAVGFGNVYNFLVTDL